MTTEKKQSSKGTCLILLLLAVAGLYYVGRSKRVDADAGKSPEERAVLKCLSAWDGSSQALVDYVKGRMNDPGSFEHVETRYTVTPTGARLRMVFRGKNGFGGVVTQVASSEVNSACELVGVPVIQ